MSVFWKDDFWRRASSSQCIGSRAVRAVSFSGIVVHRQLITYTFGLPRVITVLTKVILKWTVEVELQGKIQGIQGNATMEVLQLKFPR